MAVGVETSACRTTTAEPAAPTAVAVPTIVFDGGANTVAFVEGDAAHDVVSTRSQTPFEHLKT